MIGALASVFAVIVLANWVGFVAAVVLVAADFSVGRGAMLIVHAVISVTLFGLMMRVLDSTQSS